MLGSSKSIIHLISAVLNETIYKINRKKRFVSKRLKIFRECMPDKEALEIHRANSGL